MVGSERCAGLQRRGNRLQGWKKKDRKPTLVFYSDFSFCKIGNWVRCIPPGGRWGGGGGWEPESLRAFNGAPNPWMGPGHSNWVPLWAAAGKTYQGAIWHRLCCASAWAGLASAFIRPF